ncbi:MAG: hypothetical protein H6741_17005 [Alphaproteobacteria bacterium]|nr:hypothetical protein [Alphaproteobacteria bacterium]MCB9794415.1 hypothetical protein [Alphaproteobacteria bacterium]
MLAALLLLACTEQVTYERIEPTFLQVELVSGETGTAEAPLPFSTEAQTRTLRVTALDVNGDPTEFAGDLVVRARPGRLEMSPWITVSGGVWEGEVQTRNHFGRSRIWFSDEGDKQSDSGRTPSFATGVAEELFFELPTLAEMNRIDDHETNQLAGEFAEIRCADRDVRVLAVGPSGFWVTDLMDEPGSYNYLFVYTFSRPTDEVQIGRRLTLLTGATQEYLATTQLSYPDYLVSDEKPVIMPDPAVLDGSRCQYNDEGDLAYNEGFESGLVTLEDVVVPESFTSGDRDYEDYLEYGQWPIQAGGASCNYYVSTAISVPDYSPGAGDRFASITGTLTEVWGSWILTPRGAEDMVTGAGGPPAPPERDGPGPTQPRPRPRPTDTTK